MADIFNPKPQIDYDTEKVQSSVPSPFSGIIGNVKAEENERFLNRQKYGIELSDDQYKILNEVIANSDNPEEESYKTACAVKWAKESEMPFSECYANIDGYISELWDKEKTSSYKNAFVAISDMFQIGRNNLQIGQLGQKILEAEIKNDKEALEVYYKELEALENDNNARADNVPRKWWTEAFKAGAESLPYTGAVAGAAMLGSFVPGGQVAGGFLMSQYLTRGQAYLDLRKKGIEPDIARQASIISGALQAGVEATLGEALEFAGAGVAAVTKKGSKAISNAVSEKIVNALQKKFVLGTGQKLAVKLATSYATNLAEEGTEEALQTTAERNIENAAVFTQNKRNTQKRNELLQQAADELGENFRESYEEELLKEYPTLEYNKAGEIAKEAAESFKGGVMGALALGIVPSSVNTAVTAVNYNAVKDAAESIPSVETFKKIVNENDGAKKVFEQFGNEQEQNDAIRQVWENAQSTRDKRDAEIIAGTKETTAFNENMEEAPAENDEGETEVIPAARDENGRLYTENELKETEEGENQKGVFKIGNAEASDKNLYGYINYTLDDEGEIKTVTINDFKMTAYRRGLTQEAYDEFAQKMAEEYPDYKIEWNPTSRAGKELKELLISKNLSGKNNGLNYYTTERLADIETRKEVSKQIAQYMPNLNGDQRAAAVALLEAGARRQGYSLTDYVQNTFGGKIFGELSELDSKNVTAAQRQEMKGAQGWRRYGNQIKAVIYAGEKADFSTFAHEIAHVWQSQLTGDLKEQAEKAFNVKNGDWDKSTFTFADGHTESSGEAFARGFEQYLETGKAPNAEMKTLFQKFAEFLQDVYKTLKQFINMSPEIESVYNQLMDADDSVLKLAEKAVNQADRELFAKLQEEKRVKAEAEKAAAEEQKQAEEQEKQDTKDEESEITLDDETIAEPDFSPIEETEENENEAEPETDNKAAKESGTASDENGDIPEDMFFQKVTENLKNNGVENAKEVTEVIQDKAATITEKVRKSSDAASEALRFQLIGEKGAAALDKAEEVTIRIDNLKVAREMTEAGKDAKKIRLATGWEKGTDGLWRYEIDDSQVRFDSYGMLDFEKTNPRYRELMNKLFAGETLTEKEQGEFDSLEQEYSKVYDKKNNSTEAQLFGKHFRLYEILDNEALYKAYPKLNNIVVSFQPKNASDVNGAYSYADNSITLYVNQNDEWKVQENLKSTLLHEVQHIIQRYEGFAAGGNLEIAKEIIDEENEQRKEIHDKAMAWAWKKELEATEKKYPELSGQLGLMDKLLDEYKEDGYDIKRLEEEEWIPSREIRDKGFNLYVRGYDKAGFEEAYNEWSDKGISYFKPQNNNEANQFFKYRKFAGEVESRNVQARRNFTPEERLNTLLSETADVAEKDQIFMYDALNSYAEERNKTNKILFQAELNTDAIIDEVINFADSNIDKKFEKVIGKVTSDFVQLAEKYGENIAGYSHSIDNFFIKHDRKNHGNPKREKENGQIAITNDDFKKIPEVLKSPDYIVFGAKNKQNNKVIIYSKNMNDGSTLYVEEVRTRSKHLAANTFYKMTAASNANTLLRNPTLYVQDDHGTIKIVDVKKEIVNKNLNTNDIKNQVDTEIEAVRKQYEGTDKWLKAPNGELSNLNEKQWLQVRTPSFKNWFGDWENAQENASKVLDENGEPLVVYHGTAEDFTVFDASKSRANMDIQGNFFSPWEIDAQGYGANVRAFYLNIRNPANSSKGYSSLNKFKGQNEAGIKARELLKSEGYDGVNNDNEEYIAFNANQIKSATDNNGNFDKNIDDIRFQTEEQLYNDARSFDNWQEFMEYELGTADWSEDDVSPIPSDADAAWYKTTWELAHGIDKANEMQEEPEENNTKDETAKDKDFVEYMKKDGVLENFLEQVDYYNTLDFEEMGAPEDEEELQERENDAKLKNFITSKLRHGSWLSNAARVAGDKELTDETRKRLLSLISMNPREYRDIYSRITGNKKYAVPEEESYFNTQIAENAKRLNKLLSPDEAVNMSPEQLRQLAANLSDEAIALKIKDKSLKMDGELEHYIQTLEEKIKQSEKRQEELEQSITEDYQHLNTSVKKEIVKRYENLLWAKKRLDGKNKTLERKIDSGLKNVEKYIKDVESAQLSYNNFFKAYEELLQTNKITSDVLGAMKRKEAYVQLVEEQARLKNDKQILRQIQDMRKRLVKTTMRRVPLEKVDYNIARKIIAVQRILYPNLRTGVNRWIGENPIYLRGIMSEYLIDEESKAKIDRYISWKKRNGGRAAELEKVQKLLKNIKASTDVNKWTTYERRIVLENMPKQSWVKALKLNELEVERESNIKLDITESHETKTWIDVNGNEHKYTESTAKFSKEVEDMAKEAVGEDLFNLITRVHFDDWTTAQMEELAKKINELYIAGRDELANRRQAQKDRANEIRNRIIENVRKTNITIDDTDSPEEKEEKLKQIAKILGDDTIIKGSFESSKEKRNLKHKVSNLFGNYKDMNVRRLARILDGYQEGVNVNELYFKENDCYESKMRMMKARNEKIGDVLKKNKITIQDLYKTVEIDGHKYSVDDLLFILAADKDFQEKGTADEKVLKADPLADNDDYAPTARNAVMFGNIGSANKDLMQKMEWKAENEDILQKIKNKELSEEEMKKVESGEISTIPGTQKYIYECHRRYYSLITKAKNFLENNQKYEKLLEAIEKDYDEQFERLQKVSLEEFNAEVQRVKCYVPLCRSESNGDTNENRVREDLLSTSGAGTGNNWVDKGMTQHRVNISPLNQKPVELGLYKTWADATERTEHFINYAGYVRELNRVYKSRESTYLRRFIENRYGKDAVEYIDNYIAEVANPNANSATSPLDTIVRTLRGKTAPAYLSWKASSIIKQAATSPMPYMQFVTPVEYLKASFDIIGSKGRMYDDIKEKSIFMNNRVMDPLIDLIKEQTESATNPVTSKLNKFSEIGMQGLEWIDWACVAPGWLACYRKKYAELEKANDIELIEAQIREENEMLDPSNPERMTNDQIKATAEERAKSENEIENEAVQWADDCTRLCQPSNRKVDLAPLFKESGKGSEIGKAFLQFQTSLNVIWQNLRYDIPYAIRQKQFKQVAGMILGYTIAGILVNAITEGIKPKDDDEDKELSVLRKFLYYSTTQFTDAIPVIGSIVSNLNNKIITGDKGFTSSSNDLIPMFTKAATGTQSAIKGNWEKAVINYLEAAGLATGLPVSGAKEAFRFFGIGDGEEGAEFKPGSLLGRRE